MGGFCEADFESGVYQLQSRLEELPELFVVKHPVVWFSKLFISKSVDVLSLLEQVVVSVVDQVAVEINLN